MSHRAHHHICSCGAHVIRGHDSERAGLLTTVDAKTLTRDGELRAVLTGRTTYTLNRDRELDRRDRWSLTRPAPDPVLPDHRCDDPPDPTWLAPTTTAATPACPALPDTAAVQLVPDPDAEPPF